MGMGGSGCMGWLAGLGSPFGPADKSDRMLPPPSHAQGGFRATLSHCSRSGPTLLDTYRFTRDSLGRGDCATVRTVASRRTGSTCALKTVDKRKMLKEDLALLSNEISIHEVCDHPQIVRIYESFESPTQLHIVMEMCRGGEVLDLMQQGPLSEADASLVIQQVLQAVLYLHDVRHVAHRDLKPENLLLKFQGVPLAQNCVKLIDFGLAESFAQGERTLSAACGTPSYMAPEIMLGPYDERCDIWSCGVMLYEFLSCCVPFKGASAREILTMAASSPIRLHGSHWVGVSCLAKALIRSMCNVDASARVSAEQALQSAWLQHWCPQSGFSSFEDCSESFTSKIHEFSIMNDFQKVALRLAAYRLDDPHVAKQRNVFKSLDGNGDGRLTQEELKLGCLQMGVSAAEVSNLFQQLDADRSGYVEYSEFLSATLDKEGMPDHACWEAFRICDRDGSGSISAEDIHELLGRGTTPEERAEVCCCAGMDYDGFVAVLGCCSRAQVGGA